jgi:hypothetical protein
MIRRGVEIEPLLTSIPRGSSRIAAYQEETFPAGAVVILRLEETLVPRLHVFRDIAYVDEPYIDALARRSPTAVCVSFSDRAGPDSRREFLLDVGPLISWETPARIGARSPMRSCSRGR